MGIKIVNCDCRQPGYPKHTHSHNGEPPKVAASVRFGRERGDNRRVWVWTLVVIGLVVLRLLIKLKQHAPQLEVP